MYPDVQLYIDGAWTDAAAGRRLVVINPATGEPAGKVAHAERADLDRALEAADKGFHVWRKVSAFDRSKVMRKAADLLRSRADTIAPYLTQEDVYKRQPGGTPASRHSSARRSGDSGASSAGFSTTVQPVANAGPIFQIDALSGPFQGMIAPTTPTGSFNVNDTCLLYTSRCV